MYKSFHQKLIIVLSGLGFFFSTFAGGVQATFYVSPKGDDNNTGTTLSAPFKTIEKARDAVRTINTNMKGDIDVILLDGRYTLSSTLLFDERDGGTNGYTINYKAQNENKAWISGGRQITGWTLFDAKKNIYKASIAGLSFPPLGFRQLYVNGRRCFRARFPNFHPRDVNDYYLGSTTLTDWGRITSSDAGAQTFTIPAIIPSQDRLNRMEICGLHGWCTDYGRIQKIQTSGSSTTITMMNPERDFIFKRFPFPSISPNDRYYMCNSYSLLDTCAEWYLNDSTSELFYIPRVGEDMTNAIVMAPAVDPLLQIQASGTSIDRIKGSGHIDRLDHPVANLNFSGLVFEYSTWMKPSNSGYKADQFDNISVRENGNNSSYTWRASAGIRVIAAKNIKFEKNIFRHMGAIGVDLYYGVSNSQLIGNVFDDISATAIYCSDFSDTSMEMHAQYAPDDVRRVNSAVTISNNLILHFAREYHGGVAIAQGYSAGDSILHNEIGYGPYTGISNGWGWNSSTTPAKNNIFRSNKIHDIIQLLHDSGAFYNLSNQPGAICDSNCIQNIQYYWQNDQIWLCSLYLDEQSAGLTVRDNRTENCVNHNLLCQNFNGTVYIGTNGNSVPAAVCASAGITAPYASILSYKNDSGLAPVTPTQVMFDHHSGANIANGMEFQVTTKKGQVILSRIPSETRTATLLTLRGVCVYKETLAGISPDPIKLPNTLHKGVYILSLYSKAGFLGRKTVCIR